MVPTVSCRWYRYSSAFLRAKYSLMFGPSRSTYRAPVAMWFKIESAMSLPSILRYHSLGSSWETMTVALPPCAPP